MGIATKDLWVYYDDFAALKSISMSIDSKAITALIGPSGCGKSTFLRTLNRMNDSIDGVTVQGDVLINGSNIYGEEINTIALRKTVGMVFQRPNPFPMSIIDNITWALKFHGVKRRRDREEIAAESLKRVGLWDEVSHRLKDPAFVEELLISQKEDYTLILDSHNMEQAARVSDYTAFFLMGELIEHSPTDQLFANPKDNRTEDYITGRFG